MKEIEVRIVISGEDITEDKVLDQITEMVEKNKWRMGGGVREMTQDEIETARKEVEEMLKDK